jgi:hypothetical protein
MTLKLAKRTDPNGIGWERGYCAWGFWSGTTRLGYIGLWHPKAINKYYTCSIDLKPNLVKHFRNLNDAKKWVEEQIKFCIEERHNVGSTD